MAAAQIAFDFGHPTSAAAQPAARLTIVEKIVNTLAGAIGARKPHAVRSQPATQDPRLQLETLLRAELDAPLRLMLTDNRRTMISMRKRPGFTELRLHHMFLAADEPTVRALSAYVTRSADRAASVQLGRFIDSHRERIKKRPTRSTRLSTSGVHHDLLSVFAQVNAEHFDNQVDVRITWGRDTVHSDKRARRSIKLGSYCARDRLIRVHPALDAQFVPRFFLEYIMYHEMLHHVLPPVVRGGRRQLHDAKFKRLERAFPRYDDALLWESQHVRRLLRS